MNAIQFHQMRRMEVERHIGYLSGLNVADAYRQAGNARAALVKAHAWISVATERGMDTDVLPSLCGKLARSIADAESAYLTSCEDDIRESVRGAM